VDYGLGVDLGTTYTAAAVRVGDRLEIVQLGSQRPETPSVVFVKRDGEMLFGDAAEWRGDAEPDRLVREFKRRMGDPVSIMVAGSPYSAHLLTARLLRHVVDTVTQHQEGPPNAITVAYPANWTRFKRDFLSQAVHLAELGDVSFRTEPEVAALQYAATERVRPGETLAVYDLGGGTFDAAVLRKTTAGFELLGTPEGIEHLGGSDFDEVVLDHVTATLGPAVADLDLDDEEMVAGLARLRRDCARAKENLSFDTETTIQVALPGLHRRIRLNRSEFEARIVPPLEQTVAAMRRALRAAGVDPGDLRCVLLTGGASRIPLVGQLLAAAFDRPLVLDAHPEHSVAFGAALATGPMPVEPAESAPPAPIPPAPIPPDPVPVESVPVESVAPNLTAVGSAKVGATSAPDTPRDAAGAGGRRSAWRGAATRTAAALRTRNGRVAIGVVVVAIAAGGALQWWPQAAGNPPPQGAPSPSAPAAPVPLYTAPVQGRVETAVAVDGGRVYVASGRTIQALSRTDGKPAWTRPFTAPATITAAPYVAGDTLYVSARDNKLHLIDTADGGQLSTIDTGERDPGPATVAGNALFLGTSGGLFSKYRLPGLQRPWRYQTGNAIRHPAAVAAGLVVVGSSDGSLYAFDADADRDQDPEWRLEIGPSSAPVIAGGRVFVGSKDKKVHAIDARTHRTDWTFPTGAAVESTPAVEGALVYIGGRDGVVYAIEAETGIERWRFRGAAGESFGPVEVVAGVVYVAAHAGRLYALDAATSRVLWKHDLNGRPGPPHVADGVLYVGTSAETLHALRVAPAGPPGPVATSTAPSRTSPPPSISATQTTRRPPPDKERDGQVDRPRRTRSSTPPSPTSDPPTSPTTSRPTFPPTEPTTFIVPEID
jgi:outer membrane protein assembly factor BamB/actin-like ATPase involved in cell morphogenesis